MPIESDDESPSDCTIPTRPVPAGELSRYSVEGDPHAERDIANYVEGQAPDETVQHVERVKREVVLGEVYEIWDVTTDVDRWWVVTNLVNLYSQRHFPSLDYTLSFHIGLMARLRSRSGRVDAEDPTPFDEVFRRMDQADDRLGQAVEGEDYQAVGMQLREALLSLIVAAKARVTVPVDVETPQAANFIGWSDLLLNLMAPGGGNREVRQHVKALCKETWQLTNWLTHSRNATEGAAMIALQSSRTVIGHVLHVLQANTNDPLERCLVCSSRNIRTHFDPELPPEQRHFSSCGSCGWDNRLAEVE